HSAGDVAGVGAAAQPEDRPVGLVVVQLQVHRLAGPPAEHRQYAGGHGVQGAAVPQLAGAQHPAHLGHHVKAGPAGGLVYDQDALHQLSSPAASSTAPASARTACLTLSSVPSSSQPAARRWPPPPIRRAMAQASTPWAVRMLTRQLPPGCWRKVSPTSTPSMPMGRLVSSSRSAGSAPLASVSSRSSQIRAQRPSRWYSRWLRAIRSASIWPRLLVAKRMVFSSSIRAPASIRRAAVRWV